MRHAAGGFKIVVACVQESKYRKRQAGCHVSAGVVHSITTVPL